MVAIGQFYQGPGTSVRKWLIKHHLQAHASLYHLTQVMYADFRVYILGPILIPYATSRTLLKPSFSVLCDDARSASRNFQTWTHVAHWRLSIAMHSAGAFKGVFHHQRPVGMPSRPFAMGSDKKPDNCDTLPLPVSWRSP